MPNSSDFQKPYIKSWRKFVGIFEEQEIFLALAAFSSDFAEHSNLLGVARYAGSRGAVFL